MQIYFDTLFKKLIYVTAFVIILFGSCERVAKPANEVPVDSLAQLDAATRSDRRVLRGWRAADRHLAHVFDGRARARRAAVARSAEGLLHGDQGLGLRHRGRDLADE